MSYYIGGIMEKVTRGTGPTEYRHLIPAGSGSAILTRRSDSTTNTYYTTSDHLGSGDLVLSSTGTVLAHESFTPFGARRGANWQGVPTTADNTTFSTTTRRGFTGHEMLDSVGLIHMNGRVYDPLIGRFLSADPIIQTIALSQAINPFSYVMNNPLALIDPSGYSWLSKLFHSVGNAFHSQVFRLVLAMAVAIALPYAAPALFGAQAGLWGAVALGAITGGIAAGNLNGVMLGALAGGFAYGISSVANSAAASNFSSSHLLAATGDNLEEIVVTAQYAPAVTAQAAAQASGVAGAVAGAASASSSVQAQTQQQTRTPQNSTTCSNVPARVLGGNPRTIGKPGGLSGGTVGDINVRAGSAAVDPAQWGGKGSVRNQPISGTTKGGQTFHGITDVIGSTDVENVRQVLRSRNPGSVLIELVSGVDEGNTTIDITGPPGMTCPGASP